jgi:hypothetical protein
VTSTGFSPALSAGDVTVAALLWDINDREMNFDHHHMGLEKKGNVEWALLSPKLLVLSSVLFYCKQPLAKTFKCLVLENVYKTCSFACIVFIFFL